MDTRVSNGSSGSRSALTPSRATGSSAATTRTRGSGTRMEPEYLERFSLTERALHWVHAISFLGLLASGLVLYLPSLSQLVGRRPLLKDAHVYTAVAWIGALVLVVVLGDRRRLRQTLRELDRFDRDDV